jgi:hypothetical protein
MPFVIKDLLIVDPSSLPAVGEKKSPNLIIFKEYSPRFIK